MGFSSFSHWIVVLLIVFIIFGVGNLPKVMGDLGKGIKSFKDGLNGVKPDNHKD
jgi:sec-independent protein translocase protein TatA